MVEGLKCLRENCLRRFGYRRLHVLLGRAQVVVNHKRVQRVYRELGLTVKRTRRKRLQRELQPGSLLTAPRQEWSIDFASDVTAAHRRIRVFSVLDSFTKESLALEVDTSFPNRRVTRVLDSAIPRYGKPRTIPCDNGPELTSRHFLAWAIDSKIDAAHIRPGKPTENAYAAGSIPSCGVLPQGQLKYIRLKLAKRWL